MDSFLVGELTLGGVGLPADGQDLGRAFVPGHRAGGVVGAAGAQDQDRAAREIDAMGRAQVGKAQVIGVIAVEQAVVIDDGVHGPDGLGPGVDEGAVFHDQPLIGQGHVDGLERPLFQERPGIRLRGQGAQVVPVAAEHFMDELGVRVSKSAADESIFHYNSSLR